MRKIFFCLSAMMLLSACGQGLKSNAVVVLPEADGHVGAVAVHPNQGGPMVLNHAFAAVHGDSGGTVEPVTATQAQVNEAFGKALAARAVPPKSFTLYFLEGKDELAAPSKAVLEEVFAELGRRPVAEVTVIGHTDRVGQLVENDKLALKRATSMREALIKRGLAAEMIAAAGRGEREPLAPTADEVAEARNRRVEISIR